MTKLLIALVFSVLFLTTIGNQQVFATHISVGCPPGSTPNTNPSLTFQGTDMFCLQQPTFSTPCSPGFSNNVFFNGVLTPIFCAISTLTTGTPTPTGSCQNGAILDSNDHCVPDLNFICSTGTIPSGLHCIAQAASSIIGGALLEINTISLLVASIGTNPIITGLVGITLSGVAAQAVWFVHKRKKKVDGS